MPTGMPLMKAISDPDIGTGDKVYAIMIRMLLWLVTVPLTVICAIVLIVSRITALFRRQHAQARGEIILTTPASPGGEEWSQIDVEDRGEAC